MFHAYADPDQGSGLRTYGGGRSGRGWQPGVHSVLHPPTSDRAMLAVPVNNAQAATKAQVGGPRRRQAFGVARMDGCGPRMHDDQPPVGMRGVDDIRMSKRAVAEPVGAACLLGAAAVSSSPASPLTPYERLPE